LPFEARPPGEALLKTVQDYIDELPTWSDGTTLNTPPMTEMQWRIWALAAAGKFFEGFVVFMTGVALPLVVRQFHLGPAAKGLTSAGSLIGILVGALLLGGLSDYFGRKRMFIAEMILFCAFLALLILSTNFASLLICLFGLGLALGCDYPTAHMIISESTPSANRGKLVIGAFGFQALGALSGTGIGYLVLALYPRLGAWRWMFATALVPALVVTIGRFFVTESPSWLMVRGALEEAEKMAGRLLKRWPPYPTGIKLAGSTAAHASPENQSFLALFSDRNRRATIFASVPWFIQDVSTYGIGIFTPTILARMLGEGPDRIRSLSDTIAAVILAAQGAALINLLLIVGTVVAVMLADRIGRIRLQVFGFFGCAVGLLIASFSVGASGTTRLAFIFTGFMLFSFMTNLGPNSQTYLLAGEVFPIEVRGMGAGFAAAFEKSGRFPRHLCFQSFWQRLGRICSSTGSLPSRFLVRRSPGGTGLSRLG
jgi:MFS family permease